MGHIINSKIGIVGSVFDYVDGIDENIINNLDPKKHDVERREDVITPKLKSSCGERCNFLFGQDFRCGNEPIC